MSCSICQKPVYVKTRGLCSSCYRKLQRHRNLPPKPPKDALARKNTCIKNLKKKYGENVLKDFKCFEKNKSPNLAEIGRKYNFTREQARKFYDKLILKPIIPKNKKAKKYHEDPAWKNDPRYKFSEYKKGSNGVWKGVEAEKIFFDECVVRGFNIEILNNNSIDIKINGYLIDVKSAHTAFFVPGGKTVCVKFRLTRKQKKAIDFAACYHGLKKVFYIIPRDEFGKNISLVIHMPEKNNRYEKYKDAWHLLEMTHG